MVDSFQERLREARATRPPLDQPEDFRDFWAALVAEVRAMVVRPELDPLPHGKGGARILSARFRSVGGSSLGAVIACWLDTRARPLIVTSHGYGGSVNADYIRHLSRSGAHVIGVDARGFGRSREGTPVDPAGYLLTGWRSPSTSILRGAVADYLVAHRAALAVVGRVSHTTFAGFSFSGALATMAQAVSGTADLLAVGVPTFGWTRGRLELCQSGSGGELRDFVDEHPAAREQVLDTMRYFDIVHHAPQITGNVIVGVGRRDDIVPPATVFAMVNHLPYPPRVREFPYSHSGAPQEAMIWASFEREWLGMAHATGGGWEAPLPQG